MNTIIRNEELTKDLCIKFDYITKWPFRYVISYIAEFQVEWGGGNG